MSFPSYSFVQESLIFYLNGERVEIPSSKVDPQMTLVEYLQSRGITGTKVGCSEGGCGACTIMISSFDPLTNTVKHRGVASCLLPLPYVDHMAVTTVEGLTKSIKNLHPIQEHLAKKHATQCGFCTPGITMSLYSAVAKHCSKMEKDPKAELTSHDIEEVLDGNLCRCTGYRPILEAAHALATDYKPEDDGRMSAEAQLKGICLNDLMGKLSSELPDELKGPLRPLKLVSPTATWFRPSSLAELLDLKSAVPKAQVLGGSSSFPESAFEKPQLISGNTEIGYKIRYHPTPKPVYRTFVSTAGVSELHRVEWLPTGVNVGVATTINGLSDVLSKPPAGITHQQMEGFRAVRNLLRFFANNQVRDMGTIGGSMITCDPLSDLYPALVALNATVKLLSRKGSREILLDKFVTGPNKVDIQPDEVLISVFVPYTRPTEWVEAYKYAKRRVDAQAVVNAGLRVYLDEQHKVVDCTLAFGAVGKRAALRFTKTEQFLTGKLYNEETILGAVKVLGDEAKELVIKTRGQYEYKCTVVVSLLYRWFVAVCRKAGLPVPARTELTADESLSFQKHTGQQDYNERWSQEKSLGAPLPHLAAAQHVTGAAKFVADEPFAGLHGAYVLATRAHARIKSIDATEALQMPGVRGVYTAKDIPGINLIGSLVDDEEVLASKEVIFYDQPIAIVVAETHRQAQLASLRVKAEYEDLPHILSIEEAIAANSYLCESKTLKRGNTTEVFDKWPEEQIVKGEVRIGGQEHFYIEPQAAIVWPSLDKYVCHVTVQNLAKVQRAIARVMDVQSNMVEASMERIGGGFGGKQDRPQFLAAATAIAAHNSNSPVRMVLERDTDMKITGQRHEFLVRYRVAFTKEGKIEAIEAQLYNNGGCTVDLSPSVMEVALFAIDNTYSLPNVRWEGHCCKTNRVSCTAYRGFGKPQGIAAIESVIDHIARTLAIDPVLVRDRNMLHTGEAMIDSEVVDECLHKVWDPLREMYFKRLPEIKKWNAENRFRKRGLALTPAKNNIAFEADFMNQGGALINIYSDGSVHVSHGGTEMGQGLHTKMAQVAADELGIPMSYVSIARTGTERVPNTHPTAACTGTELNAGAIVDACRQINERLAPVRAKLGGSPTWEKLIHTAYFDRVCLAATGHYEMKFPTYNWETGKGLASFYRIWGAALTEVELDTLTGNWRVVRTDILQDNGSGLNPAIDVGQVEGGFVQGLGLYTLEELIWAADGHIRTRNVSTYKIPTHDDIPLVFNVSLLKGVTNTRAVKGNKTVGEAGIQLAVSVVHAIKSAVYAAKEDNSSTPAPFFQLNTPATVERIRLSCPTSF